MQVNFRQGFFRAWIVVSALWVIAISALSYGGISTEFAKDAAIDRALMARIEAESIVLVPVSCPGDGTVQVRGVEGADFTRDSMAAQPWDRYLCWYEMPAFRRLYPEYSDIADEPLTERLYAQAGRPTTTPKPWGKVAQAASLALVPPIILIVLGAAISWVLSGFFRRPA